MAWEELNCLLTVMVDNHWLCKCANNYVALCTDELLWIFLLTFCMKLEWIPI